MALRKSGRPLLDRGAAEHRGGGGDVLLKNCSHLSFFLREGNVDESQMNAG